MVLSATGQMEADVYLTELCMSDPVLALRDIYSSRKELPFVQMLTSLLELSHAPRIYPLSLAEEMEMKLLEEIPSFRLLSLDMAELKTTARTILANYPAGLNETDLDELQATEKKLSGMDLIGVENVELVRELTSLI
jgi:hypothetical protein